jgi:hypothetical protein
MSSLPLPPQALTAMETATAKVERVKREWCEALPRM